METGLTRQRIISELVKSPHGKLAEYLDVGRQAASTDPEFFAHLIAWNVKKGLIRDSKVALPLLSLEASVNSKDDALKDNALAAISLLSPRDMVTGLRFAKTAKIAGRRQALNKLLATYLRYLESNYSKWERTAVQHRDSLKSLYSLTHTQPAPFAEAILFQNDYPSGSVFDKIKHLKDMSPVEAAAFIITKKIPFLVASPALGSKLKDPDVLVALINRMTAAEITIHMKMFEKLGVKSHPATRGALAKALADVSSSNSSALKLSKAIEAVEDEELKEALTAVQEKKLDKSSIGGNWAILADKSSSMHTAIKLSVAVAEVLGRLAGGEVHLVFFDSSPQPYNITGKSLAEIQLLTKYISANGYTSIGVGLSALTERATDVDGIVIVSDGGENTAPAFSVAYNEYVSKFGKRVPVYLYHVKGDPNSLARNCELAGIELTIFEIGDTADYYSIPGLVETMRTNRYSLVDEIMETPLLTLKRFEKVIAGVELAHA